MAKSSIPLTQEKLKLISEYNPETGVFTWKFRPDHPQKWNTKHAGKTAGYMRPDGYCRIVIDYRPYQVHRLAWLYVHGEWPEHDVDHADLDRSHNWISNLRLATRTQNMGNQRKSSTNTSGFKGVYRDKRRGKWAAHIQIDHRRIFLGYFCTPETGHLAYCAAAFWFFCPIRIADHFTANQAANSCYNARNRRALNGHERNQHV
jgi:hypothetical protein